MQILSSWGGGENFSTKPPKGTLADFTRFEPLIVQICYGFLPRCIECRRGLVSSDDNSICPSVKRMHCDKTEERSVQIFIPYERIVLVGGTRPLLPKILGQPTPVQRNRRFCTDIRS